MLLDVLLLGSFRGMIWIAEQVREAVNQERSNEDQALNAELQRLYLDLERGQITELEFDAREQILLDRLDERRDTGTLDDDD